MLKSPLAAPAEPEAVGTGDFEPTNHSLSATYEITATAHDGPLPSPETLAQYERAHPGTASWILAEANAAATHFRAVERRAIDIRARDLLLYRLLPFAAVTVLIAASVLIAIFASAWLGSAALAATLGSAVLAYLKSQPKG